MRNGSVIYNLYNRANRLMICFFWELIKNFGADDWDRTGDVELGNLILKFVFL